MKLVKSSTLSNKDKIKNRIKSKISTTGYCKWGDKTYATGKYLNSTKGPWSKITQCEPAYKFTDKLIYIIQYEEKCIYFKEFKSINEIIKNIE